MKRLNLKNRIFYLRLSRGHRVVHKVQTKKLSRFSLSLQMGEILQPGCSVYIKVTDEPRMTNSGKMMRFYNSGTYTDRKELMKAYHAFIE